MKETAKCLLWELETEIIMVILCSPWFFLTENVNEYLRLAASASEDKQQLARIKAVFEKKNQKSTQSISTLQKKLEGYSKRIEEIQTSGVTSHKKAKEVLSDMGHGLK